MDNKVSVDQLGVTGNVSCKVIDKMDAHSADMETDEILHLSLSPAVDKGGIALRPITPESNKESSELMSSSPPSTGFCLTENDDDIDSPRTPKAAVFDPFAPGPDNLLLAPRSMKYLQESRSYVERKLSFNSVMTKNDCKHVSESALEDDADDDMLLEAVYDSLLECIIAKQAEGILGEISAVDSSSPDSFTTPPFAPRLTGIAETCPDAPLKPVKKSRIGMILD
ncbi:hypothetical protein L1987_86179 [Smallanthus sonchifolius]|uniref:Uncharacterized protein n=1 Tax=Smallanthus sonchifolius TaxID=185202 RepID=A0ACB8XYN8_9ASTR|nr:hypothetical protein L1987_86179 [Smallanthus sonchifolius]